MRILQVHAPYRERGGEDAVVASDRAVLEQAGHQVEQYTEPNPVATVGSIGRLVSSAWNVSAQRRVGTAVSRFRPDVVHVHNTWFALSPSVLQSARSRGVPVVMTVHNFRISCANSLFLRDGLPCEDCLHFGAHHAIKNKCYRSSRILSSVAATNIELHSRLHTWSRLVDRFICLSDFAAARLVEAGIPMEKVERGSNFVSDPGRRPAPPSASRHVVFLGRLSEEKGVRYLLDAWRQADPRGLRLAILGDGPERAALEARAPNGVDFHGFLSSDQVRAWLLRARAVILPSTWYEGQPISALEALAAGVPLVLSDIGGLPELLGARAAGLLAKPGDAGDLAERVTDLLDGEKVDRHGREARTRYEEAFQPADAAARLEQVYASVNSGRCGFSPD